MSANTSSVRVGGGRAVERTALAWNRSAFSIAATGGLLVKAGADEGSLMIGLLGGGLRLALVPSGLALRTGRLPPRGHRPLRALRAERGHRGLTAVSVGTGLLAAGIVLAG